MFTKFLKQILQMKMIVLVRKIVIDSVSHFSARLKDKRNRKENIW